MSEDSSHAVPAPRPGPREPAGSSAEPPADVLDALLVRADDLAGTPLSAHADVFEQIHAELERRLRAADA